MAKKRASSERNRERIITAAARLIVSKGVADTSLADIARETGISKGTLYYYYPNKGDLIFDISERHLQRLTSKLFDWMERSGKDATPERVLRMTYEIVMKSTTKGIIHLYLIQEALANHPPLRDRFRQEYPRWVQMIQSGIERVRPGSPDNDVLASLVMASIDGYLIQKLLGVDRISIDRVARYLSDK
ncbi:TetR/AcrR family transcriptional regulator [Spirochaeta africana]|uniref:Transcriptional regulator n=1 Tax=Spirochaeta africana (strain ATCC 700263 / DSM 8902 / Z-7692) TaxID=889378 RepID=H9UKP8_SPIAZ|nr:TetR/AcrR family transcriptional regulator [Spirochaeta africana]AFG38091.1 transcriptional regulator [Spirochaeta africana DSM 8902]